MEIRFFMDAQTDQPHIYGHGVTEEEVRQVLQRPGEDRSGDEGSRIKLAQTTAGRFLKVIYRPDKGADGIFVITAYEMRGKARQAFRRRQRRKKT